MELRSVRILRPLFVPIIVLIFSGNIISAFAQQEKANEASKTIPSQESTEADKLHAQVVALFREKKFSDALPMAKRTVELREKSLGLENEKTISSLKNLAAIYTELGKHGDVVNVRERVLKAEETLHGPSSIKLSDNLTKLGGARLQNNKVGGAIEAFKRNLQIQEVAYGLESKELVQTLHDLAMLSQRDGNLNQAILYFKRLIQIKEKDVGANHPDIAELLAKYAIILSLADKKKEAEEVEARARAIYAALPNQQEPETIEPKIL